jgi:hypothetical protein
MAALTLDENQQPQIVSGTKGALGNIAKDQSAAKTPTNALGLDDTTLSALGGIDKVTAAVNLAEKLAGTKEKFDPALAALLYFTKMGEIASKPGATLLGSVAGAGIAPAQYLMQKRKEEKDRQREVGKTAVTLATLLDKQSSAKKTAYTNTQTGKIEYYSPKEFAAIEDTSILVPYKAPPTGLKTVGSGTLAKYFKEKDAREFVKSQGVAETSPNFSSLVKRFTAPSESMINQPITEGGVYLEAVPLARGTEVINIQLTPSKSPVKPYFSTYVEKRIPLIAKATDTYNTTAREVLPRVEEAMSLLKSGRAPTGAVEEKLLQTKRLFNNAFGVEDPTIIALETLQSTSNFIAPKMRPAGSGSTSDMEFKAYQRASLDIGNTPKANYISLYSFKKMSENAVKLNQKEQELLTSGKFNNMRDVNKELNKFDKGIFEKYTGDFDDPDAIKEWMDSLPDGAVIINNGIFNTPDPYIIKGWGK